MTIAVEAGNGSPGRGAQDLEAVMPTGRGGETTTDVMMIQSAERTTSGGAIAEVFKVVAVVDEMTETGTDEEEELTATATGHCAPPFLKSFSAEASVGSAWYRI